MESLKITALAEIINHLTEVECGQILKLTEGCTLIPRPIKVELKSKYGCCESDIIFVFNKNCAGDAAKELLKRSVRNILHTTTDNVLISTYDENFKALDLVSLDPRRKKYDIMVMHLNCDEEDECITELVLTFEELTLAK
jgi:hypothetical protein